MTSNAHDPRTLEQRLEWIADWSEPGIDLADAGTAREALDRIKSQDIRTRQLERQYAARVHADNAEMDGLRAELREAEHARDGETRRADYTQEQAERLAYTLGCIANEDWTYMTADDAREEARRAVEATAG